MSKLTNKGNRMKKLIATTVLLLNLNAVNAAIPMEALNPSQRAMVMVTVAPTIITFLPTYVTGCVQGDCGLLKELDAPQLQKEVYEIAATGESHYASEELMIIIEKLEELRPEYQSLTIVEILRREIELGKK